MLGWLIALGVLTLLAIAPIGVSALYNDEGPLVRLILGPIRWTVYPAKKKKAKTETEKKTKTKTAKPAQKKEASQKGGSWEDFLPLVKTVLEFLVDFRGKLRVSRLELKLILAGDDPSDLAINYGRAWAALGNLMPQLERLFIIKKRDVEVECDFTAESTVIYARLDLTVTLGRLIRLALRHGVPVFKAFKELKSQRGAKT